MYFIPSKIFLAGRRKRRIFPRHLEEWVPPFHVENEKKKGMEMDGDDSIRRNRSVTSLDDRREIVDYVCD